MDLSLNLEGTRMLISFLYQPRCSIRVHQGRRTTSRTSLLSHSLQVQADAPQTSSSQEDQASSAAPQSPLSSQPVPSSQTSTSNPHPSRHRIPTTNSSPATSRPKPLSHPPSLAQPQPSDQSRVASRSPPSTSPSCPTMKASPTWTSSNGGGLTRLMSKARS